MKYKCVNQTDKFSFRDAQIQRCRYNTDVLMMEVDGVIARYDHPCNETLTDRYIDTVSIRLKKPVIRSFFLEGAKYYDANDVLLEEIPDRDIDPGDYEKIFEKLKQAYIFKVLAKEEDDCQVLEIAVDVGEDTYWFETKCEKAVFEWDNFLNKAMQEG